MSRVERFKIDLLTDILRAGRERSRTYLIAGNGAHKSRQLAKEMRIFLTTESSGFLYVDPYWAIHFHDGRKAIRRARGESSLVWFKDLEDDPRLNNGKTPNRASDLKSLTREQFEEAAERGQIYVRRQVKGVRPTPFFGNEAGGGMDGFVEEVGEIVRRKFIRFLEEEVRGLREDLKISMPIRV